MYQQVFISIFFFDQYIDFIIEPFHYPSIFNFYQNINGARDIIIEARYYRQWYNITALLGIKQSR